METQLLKNMLEFVKIRVLVCWDGFKNSQI